EAAIMEPLMGLPAGFLPRDAAHVDAYLQEMLSSGTLVVTDTSRALARAVLYPPRWHAAWLVFRPMQLLTIGTLPPSLRQAYGFAWHARDQRALDRWIAMLRIVRRVLPPMVREWPMARRRVPAGSLSEVAVH
ncbi:MAG: oxygenase MpaB family protein, partial [Vicinamibacterales bacterium]